MASIFQFMGYLSVAVFFFLSGYGLALSYDKKPGYIDEFPKNRILDFYIKYCVLAFSACVHPVFKLSDKIIKKRVNV